MAHFTQFASLEALDRKVTILLIQSITVLGKKELPIQFNYDNEYNKAFRLKINAQNELKSSLQLAQIELESEANKMRLEELRKQRKLSQKALGEII